MISVPALGLEPRNPKEEIYSLPQLPLCDTGLYFNVAWERQESNLQAEAGRLQRLEHTTCPTLP